MSLAAFALVGIVSVILSDPLRRSNDAVQSWLLTQVPVGSNIEQLMSAADQRDWRVNGSWDGNQPQLHSDWGGIDGAKVVWIYVGGYRSVFRTDLDSFWAFDESGRLIGVKIRRMTDAL